MLDYSRMVNFRINRSYLNVVHVFPVQTIRNPSYSNQIFDIYGVLVGYQKCLGHDPGMDIIRFVTRKKGQFIGRCDVLSKLICSFRPKSELVNEIMPMSPDRSLYILIASPITNISSGTKLGSGNAVFSRFNNSLTFRFASIQ